jgi:hypothetical protein
MLINDDECDTGLPSSLEDRYIQPSGFARPHANQPPFAGFLATIQSARVYSQVHQAVRLGSVGPQPFQIFDDKFHSIQGLFTEAYQLGSSLPLEPNTLVPIFALHNARFLLFRRNLSPAYMHPERVEAIHRCAMVAKDTTNYILRTLHASPGGPNSTGWRARVGQIASNMVSLHLWRCILMLCFRTDYEGALMCLHMSSAIGELRKINVACGKNIIFFLERLIERVRSGNGATHQLEHDEEILAYVSGDMQGNYDQSWVWAGASSTQVSPQSSSPNSTHHHRHDEPMTGTSLTLRPNTGSSQNGSQDWDGWTQIEGMIHQLMEEQRARLNQPNPYYPPPHNPVKRVQLAPGGPASPTRSGPLPPPTPSGTSRISIANII